MKANIQVHELVHDDYTGFWNFSGTAEGSPFEGYFETDTDQFTLDVLPPGVDPEELEMYLRNAIVHAPPQTSQEPAEYAHPEPDPTGPEDAVSGTSYMAWRARRAHQARMDRSEF